MGNAGAARADDVQAVANVVHSYVDLVGDLRFHIKGPPA